MMFKKFVVLITVLSFSVSVSAEKFAIPAGTVVYGELDQEVISKKKKFSVGDIVRARVWRNVVVDGRTVVNAGTPMVVRISHLKTAKIAGIKGDLELELVSVEAIDGSNLLLDGGYDKSGKGRKALSTTLFLLVAWPLIFLKGKHAKLAPGTVFDGVVASTSIIEIRDGSSRILDLSRVAGPSVTVLYDDFEEAEETDNAMLPMLIKSCQGGIMEPAIVKVNGEDTKPIKLKELARTEDGECSNVRVAAPLKKLAKLFRKGINTFVVRFDDTEIEVVLEIEL